MVVGRLERLQRWLLWGGGDDQKKISWVSWEDICTSREKGGLGIRDLRKFDITLLGK